MLHICLSVFILAHSALFVNRTFCAVLCYLWVIIMYQRIRDLREDHDLTQREIAEQLQENEKLTEFIKHLYDLNDEQLDALLKMVILMKSPR